MLRVALVWTLQLLAWQPALADGSDYSRPRYAHRHWLRLPPARHVVEVVQPPYSGNFIINGIRFTGNDPGVLPLDRGRTDHAPCR